MLPRGLSAEIRKGSWDIPAIFGRIAEKGNVDEEEMFATFNMGIGLIMAVSPEEKEDALEILVSQGEKPVLMGQVVTSDKGVILC